MDASSRSNNRLRHYSYQLSIANSPIMAPECPKKLLTSYQRQQNGPAHHHHPKGRNLHAISYENGGNPHGDAKTIPRRRSADAGRPARQASKQSNHCIEPISNFCNTFHSESLFLLTGSTQKVVDCISKNA